MHEKENRIKDERTMEATKNEFVGLSGKFGRILKTLGQPILKSGSNNYESSYLPDYYDMDEDEYLPTMDEDEIIMDTGMYFSGLSRGMNLEIIYKYDEKELRVTDKGKVVYREYNADLDCYIPGSWEKDIEKLIKLVKKVDADRKLDIIKHNDTVVKNQKLSMIEYLKNKWGI